MSRFLSVEPAIKKSDGRFFVKIVFIKILEMFMGALVRSALFRGKIITKELIRVEMYQFTEVGDSISIRDK